MDACDNGTMPEDESDEDPFNFGGLDLDNVETQAWRDLPAGESVGGSRRNPAKPGLSTSDADNGCGLLDIMSDVYEDKAAARELEKCNGKRPYRLHKSKPHELYEQDGQLRCRGCPRFARAAAGTPSKSKFASSECLGYPADRIDASHVLWKNGHYLWCRRCGGISDIEGTRMPRILRGPCNTHKKEENRWEARHKGL